MIEQIYINDYLDKLETLKKRTDHYDAHLEADDILCEILTKLGYNEIVEAYHQVHKWYG